MNWFEKKAIERIMPYEYDDTENVEFNQRVEFFHNSSSLFDIPIIVIGLFFLIKNQKKKYKHIKGEKCQIK